MCFQLNNDGIKKCTCKFRDSCIQRLSESETRSFKFESEKQGAVLVSYLTSNKTLNPALLCKDGAALRKLVVNAQQQMILLAG